MSFANSFSSFPPPGTAQAPRLVDTPPRPVPRAPEATVPAVPSPIGAADQLRDQQDVRDLEIVNQRLLDAIASGDKADQRRKIAELMAVVGRAER